MSHRLRIGSRIGSADPFWVQVREAVYQKAQQLAIDLVPIDVGHSSRFSKEEHAELVDELLGHGNSIGANRIANVATTV